MLAAIVGCAVLVIVATLLHYEALGLLARRLDRLDWPPRARLIVAVLGCFIAHALEMALYGAGYAVLLLDPAHGTLAGVTPDLSVALYFSAETYTSLGFGDVVPKGPIRFVAGIEALNGLLLIGWSASFIYLEMERHWRRGTR